MSSKTGPYNQGTAATANVQDGPTDTTSGRLIPTENGYYKGNILGTVSQSGGVPTGAIIETGTVAGQGRYIKYASGTMECTHDYDSGVDFSVSGSSAFAAQWSFPQSFVGRPEVSGLVLFNGNTSTSGRAGQAILAGTDQGRWSESSITPVIWDIGNLSDNINLIIKIKAKGRWF